MAGSGCRPSTQNIPTWEQDIKLMLKGGENENSSVFLLFQHGKSCFLHPLKRPALCDSNVYTW